MSAERPTLSVLLITLDEERMLEQVLESVAWADEIVVVDSGSTDRTEEIARRFTPHFHVMPWEGEGLQRMRSLELATGDWVFFVDGDEVVTPELSASIQAAMREPRGAVAFQVQFLTRFAGRWFGNRGWQREWKIRLFRRDRGRFKMANIHSGAVVEGPVGRIAGPLLHFSYIDIRHQTEKMNRFSSGVAADLFARGKRSGPFLPVARGFLHFLRDYLPRGEFLYGGAGFVRAALVGYYTFLKYVKLWELGVAERRSPTDTAASPPPGESRPRARPSASIAPTEPERP